MPTLPELSSRTRRKPILVARKLLPEDKEVELEQNENISGENTMNTLFTTDRCKNRFPTITTIEKSDVTYRKRRKDNIADSFAESRERKILQRWEKQVKNWEKLKLDLQKKTKKKNQDLTITRSENYRAILEERDLLTKSKPVLCANERHWQMMLRDGGVTRVPVGNIFSGLYCKVFEVRQPLPETIRRVPKSAKEETFQAKNTLRKEMKKFRNQLSKNMDHLKPNRLEDVGGLIIEGQDLFGDKIEIPSYSLDFQGNCSDPEPNAQEQIASDALDIFQEPESFPLTPEISISHTELTYESPIGGAQSRMVELTNLSSHTIYCTWIPVDHENHRAFDSNQQEFTILPSQKHSSTFTFHPTQAGFFFKRFRLGTLPANADSVEIALRAQCVVPDNSRVAREQLAKSLSESRIPPPPPKKSGDIMPLDGLDLCLEFYERNPLPQLYFHEEAFNAWKQLASDMIAQFRRRRRNEAQWDLRVCTLQDWLQHVVMGESEFKTRIDELMEASKILPKADPLLTKEISNRLAMWVCEFPSIKHRAIQSSSEQIAAEEMKEAEQKEAEKLRLQAEREKRRAERANADNEDGENADEDEEEDDDPEEEEEEEEIDEAVLEAAELARKQKIDSLGVEIFHSRANEALKIDIATEARCNIALPHFSHCAGPANCSFPFEPFKASKSIRDVCGNEKYTILACDLPRSVWVYQNEAPQPPPEEKAKEDLDDDDEEDDEEDEEDEDEVEVWVPALEEILCFREFDIHEIGINSNEQIFALTSGGDVFMTDIKGEPLSLVLTGVQSIAISPFSPVGYAIQKDRIVSLSEDKTALALPHVHSISISSTHSVVMTKDGNVYWWGEGAGVGLPDSKEESPTLLFLGESWILPIVSAHASENATFILAKDGSFWRIGDEESIPQLQDFEVKFSTISKGKEHWSGISMQGELFSWGQGQGLGILPNKDGISNSTTPLKLNLHPTFLKTVASSTFIQF